MAWYDSVNPKWLSTRLYGGKATEGLSTQGENHGYLTDVASRGLNTVNAREAPMAQSAQLGQAAQLDSAQQAQVRAQQQQTAGYLQGILGGQQAGAGELAVNRQVGQANAAQMAAARMARGAGAALAARGAARNQMDIGLAGAGQAAQAQMGDQQMAVGQLGGLLAQTREGDLGLAGQNAQLQQQRMLQQGQFQQTGMNDQQQLGYMAQLGGMDQAQWEREIAKRQIALGDRGSIGNIFNAGGQMLAQYAGQKK
jgi:hypothetical protein